MQAASETQFVIGSPLLVGKAPKSRDSCMQNVAPFWALLRCVGPRDYHNMELDTVVFRDPGFEIIGGAYPQVPKGARFAVHIPMARNVSRISKGEGLRLSFGADV